MINYCETDQCLRQFILSYFGDTSPCTCDKCSNCVVVEDEPEELYLTIRKDKEKNFLNNYGNAGQILLAKEAYHLISSVPTKL